MNRIYIILFLLFTCNSYAQVNTEKKNKIESIKKVIDSAKNDSVIIIAWSQWDNLIYLSDPEMDLILNRKIDSLSSVNLKKTLDNQSKKFFQNSKGYALNNIGIIYNDRGDYAKAIDYYQKSLELNKEIGDQLGIANALNNIGVIYTYLGDFTRAIEYYEEVLEITSEIGDKKGKSHTLNNIALIYSDKGEYDKALNYYSKSLDVKKEIDGKIDTSNLLHNIGAVYRGMGNYDKALDYFFKSLKIKEINSNQLDITTSLNLIGSIYEKKGDYKNAIDYSLRALVIAQEVGAKQRVLNASKTCYQTYVHSNKVESSRSHLSRIIDLSNSAVKTNFFTLPEKQKQTYFSTMESDYGLYLDFALHFQDQFKSVTDTAYNIALQNKGITLKSSTAMRQSIEESGDTTLIRNYKNWLLLKKKIANTYTQDSTYKYLIEKANELERELVKESNTFSDFDQMMNLKWQDVQDGLKEGEAAIEFVHFLSEIDTANPTIYAALLITKNVERPKMIRICSEEELTKILGTLQGNNLNFVNQVYGTKNKAQSDLYNAIWKPLEEPLSDIKSVYISPSGLLHKVAFHSLSKGQNVFLCDNYTIRQFNTTGVLTQEQNALFSQDKLFLVSGGVKYNTDTTFNEIWRYLPGTLDETKEIKSILENKNYKVDFLSSKNANEKTIKDKAPQANVIHIATHGFFFPDPEKVRKELEKDEEYIEEIAFRGNNNAKDLKRSTRYADLTFIKNKNPLMRSGIVLANANDVWQRPALKEGQDGVLTASEVSTLNLKNTDLVVLSACETGLGDILGSEGVYGLQRAFKMAGANYTIMSLWKVPDAETAAFMKLFYKNLTNLKDIPKAFEKTRANMRKKHDPYYWAAFVLVE